MNLQIAFPMFFNLSGNIQNIHHCRSAMIGGSGSRTLSAFLKDNNFDDYIHDHRKKSFRGDCLITTIQDPVIRMQTMFRETQKNSSYDINTYLSECERFPDCFAARSIPMFEYFKHLSPSTVLIPICTNNMFRDLERISQRFNLKAPSILTRNYVHHGFEKIYTINETYRNRIYNEIFEMKFDKILFDTLCLKKLNSTKKRQQWLPIVRYLSDQKRIKVYP